MWVQKCRRPCLEHWRYNVCLFPQNVITPSEVQQWTNHRVMEWLRSVDLAEYAPNLRGSGVHGGLMVKLFQSEIDCLLGSPWSQG